VAVDEELCGDGGEHLRAPGMTSPGMTSPGMTSPGRRTA
jgi:hypothetical protein